MKELIIIQAQLKAPKNQFNDFGGYKYRNCEDILEAAKPLLAAQECILTLTDDILFVGDRFYVRATITITNKDGKTVTTTACARESADKKGMDAAQITGAASSYARKYALNGLFLIDDTKDADTTNDHGKAAQAEPTIQEVEAMRVKKAEEFKKANPIGIDSKLGKTPPVKPQAPSQEPKTITARVLYHNLPRGASTYHSFGFEGHKGQYFSTNDGIIIETLDSHIENKTMIRVEYTATPWEKNGKSGINLNIVGLIEEAQPGD